MIKQKIQKHLYTIISFGAGVGGHHYGSKLLSASEDRQTLLEQQARDNTVNDMKTKVDNIETQVREIREMNTTYFKKFQDLREKLLQNGQNLDDLPKEKIQQEEVIESIKIGLEEGRTSIEQGNKYLENLQTDNENFTGILSQAKASFNHGLDRLTETNEILVKIYSSSSKFIQNWNLDLNLNAYYEFLDSLTLLEEAAFLHILYIVLILSMIINIYSAFFANEIIKYFKLEEKYPKLNKFFSLRLKFQRYYLIVNLIWLLVLSLFYLGLDVMVFGLHFIS